MRRVLAAALVGTGWLAAVTAVSAADAADEFWPQSRGPQATGVAPSANPPVAWSETQNIRWKIEVPGRGSASPVVWGDRIFLLTAVPAGRPVSESHVPRGGMTPRVAHEYEVLAINRADGTVAWQRTARQEVPHEASHQDNGTWASASAVTDGAHVIASFESRGIFCDALPGAATRTGGQRVASPVGAAGRVYIPGRDGTTVVITHGPTFEVLAENTLDDGFDASPAVVDRDLYLRGYRYLYAISDLSK